MPSIINNVAETMLWDIFVMGTFFIGAVWLTVVFAIALASRDKLSVTLNHEVARLRVWLGSPTMKELGLLGLLALVFDNDYKTAKLRSLLAVTDSVTFEEPAGE